MNDMEYKNVVWDWNGTLLDDVKISVDTINVMLERKHLGKLTGRGIPVYFRISREALL